MPLFFDKVQRASWAGYPFPVNEIDIHGQARLFVHEQPHADGGALEPLGRKPYIIRMRMQFDEGDLLYPDAYPTTLDTLRFLAESGQSAKLVVPNVGTIQAFCPQWTQRWTAMIRSGEHAEYEWIEDQSAQLKQVFFSGVSSARTMQQRASDLAAQKPTLDALDVDQSLLSKVLTGVNDIVSMRDRADLTAQLAADKIASLTNALQQLDEALTTPYGCEVLESVKRLWQTHLDFQANVKNTLAPPALWTVPMMMGVAQISQNIFGDVEHQTDILGWNPIEDAFAVPAGTQIRYLPQAA